MSLLEYILQESKMWNGEKKKRITAAKYSLSTYKF